VYQSEYKYDIKCASTAITLI